MSNIITYESIYEILRKEKYNKELQELDPNFFKDVITYLKEKKKILKSQEENQSIFASQEIKKTKIQLENIKKILNEIYDKRESKIIGLAVLTSKTKDEQDISFLLPEEKKFFDSVLKILGRYREDLLNSLLKGKLPSLEKPKELKSNKEEENQLVRFSQAIPKFVGQDLNIYGPFEKQDIANLPKDIADLLIKKKKATSM